MRFQKGVSGNPSGRPKKDTANLRPLLAKHGQKVLQKVVDAAMEGDMMACKIILERIYPPIKAQALTVQIQSEQGLVNQGQAVVDAVLSGNIPPDTGATLITALASQAKLTEIDEMNKRLERIEALIEGKS